MNRFVWADRLKGLLIVLVVLGHAIQEVLNAGCFHNQLWNIIYSFHMPAFMAVSGYLNFRPTALNAYRGRGGRLSVCSRRFWQLLVPYLLWSLLKWITYQHCELIVLPQIVLYPDIYFWFLWVLFFIVVFFNIGDWLVEKLRAKQEYVMVGLCLFFAILMVVADIRVLGYQFFAYYFIFFTAGYYLHKYENFTVRSNITDNNLVLLLLTVIWLLMAWHWRMHELPPFLIGLPIPQALLQYAYRFLTAFMAIYVMLGIGPKLMNVNRKDPLEKLGQISLGIYTVHLLLMPVVVNALKLDVDDKSVIIALSFVITLPLSWFLVWLLSKWTLTNRLLLGKI